MRSSPVSPSLLLVLGVLLIFTGTVSTYALTIEPAQDVRMARAWRETSCHVTSSKVAVDRRGKRASYDPVIEYEYEVGGRRYTGSRVAFTSTSGDRVDADETVARYPLGWDTPCWYDPANPTSATLSRTVPESFWPALHLLFLFSGLGILSVGAQQRRDRRGSGVPELIAVAWIATVIGVIAYHADDLGHATTAGIACGFVVILVGWFAHELRSVLRGP